MRLEEALSLVEALKGEGRLVAADGEAVLHAHRVEAAENQLLASQLSSAAASARIQSLAKARGLVPADPAATTYVELGRSRR